MAVRADDPFDRHQRLRWWAMRLVVYGLLITWAVISIFPIYWTLTTSFKLAPNVMQGHLIPFVDYTPAWRGWKSTRAVAGHPVQHVHRARRVHETLFKQRDHFGCRIGCSRSLSARLPPMALVGFPTASASCETPIFRSFFLSQLILPPVVLALPFLVLYKELALLDSRIGMIAIYTLMVLPIVIWIMRDQFASVPVELEEAALVDGLSIWGAFLRIVLPLVLPGIVAAFILSLVLCWNEYFFAALLTSTDAKTLPVMIASQTGSQGINWWSMAALSSAGILPLIVIGILLEKHIIKGMTAGAVK